VVTLSAAADVGWTFAGFDPNAVVTMDDNKTVTATFTQNEYTIAASADPNGTVDPNGSIVKTYGEEQQFTAYPNIGYTVNKWYLDGNDVQTGSTSYTLTNITANHTVLVTFEQLQSLRDDFNDNRRSAMWRVSADDPESTRVIEDVNRLNVISIGGFNMAASCVGHWKMNDNEPNTRVIDSSDKGNNGTARRNTSDLHTDSGNPPYLNGALIFNGSSDYYITTPMTNFPSGAAARSVSLWMKWNGSTTYNIIFGYGDDAAGNKLFGAFLNSGGSLYCWNNYQTASSNYDTGIDIAVGNWTHVVLTYDGTNVMAYKNGVLVDTRAKALDTVLEKSAIGRNAWSTSYFAGSIDNMMLFDKELSPDEISYLYNNGDGTETIPSGAGYGSALYAANGWNFDVAEDFEVKVDFHYSDTSGGDGLVEMALENTEGNYVSLSAGFDGNEAYFYYEKAVDGNVAYEQVSRALDDGALYLSYDASLDELYLSFTDYGPGKAWQTITGLLAGQWSSAPVRVAVGGDSAGAALGQGEAYLDNFEVTTAALLGWPPATDIDGNGFIEWDDLKIICENWLLVDPDVRSDLYKDEDNIVNFLDFAEFGPAW
jgi:hypothetical protein